jgi:PAS domain S-box-containing protein
MDIDGTILYTNPANVALTGYSTEEALRQNWQTLQGDDGCAGVYRSVQKAMQACKSWRGEMASRRKDGTPYDVAITVTPLFAPDDAGQLVGSVWVQRDITPLKEAERFKDQFVSNVSHELRTPLSIITLVLGNLDRLYDRLDHDKRREMVRSIREQVAALNDLTDSVLEISRIDGQRISMERVQLDLVRLVRAEMERQGPLAKKKLLSVHLAGAETLVVRGNEGQLRQVIRNLLNNAIKFTQAGGRIACDCQVWDGGGGPDAQWPGRDNLPSGRWVALRVADTGIGIDAADIPRLFERFFRVSPEGNVPGTGLGLAITHELVEFHGGHLAVASTPGQGSVFAVYLPVLEEE